MWEDHLHFELLGEHVLIDGLHLESAGTFLVASLLAASICFTERYASHASLHDSACPPIQPRTGPRQH